ncbi:glycosyltransferase [Ornithinimicrobium sp. CNJ-824]|uniref:glycosyltransferase n=1 Tax=Ornithinimicrobium sp. CNJ-824 TaxID=1904966 RepID=UPI00117F35F7|nr:glycosyltransferase [Ornithinimicrobium sp. CNJ-824]
MSIPAAPRTTTSGVAADHARIAARRPRALVSTALRTRSVHAREVLAEAAWPGHDPGALEGWFREHPPGFLPPGSDPARLADYARVLAVQTGLEEEVARARTVLESLNRSDGWSVALREHVELLGHLRVLGGDTAGALELADDGRMRTDVADAIRADALNPALGGAATDGAAWAAAFTRALDGGMTAAYLPPTADGRPSLDRLRVEDTPAVRRPELVTVIMSAYRPGPALLTAVRSVLAQTWQNLELLVVDDASGPGEGGAWSRLLDEACRLDPRVQVVRKAVNGGTYRARNTALRRARGDWAVVVDSDDWWHPQTLELLAAPLLADPRLLATRAEGVRVTPELVLTRPGYRPRFVSAATVLYRLRPVISRIGFYDPTRKGADTEHTRRMQAAFGEHVLRDVRAVTTLLRGGGESLSSDEFGNGWRHPARHQHKSLYGPWHEQIAAGEATPFLDPEEPRRFPEPRRWSRPTHPLLAPSRHYDLCLAGDWRRHGGPQRSMVEEVRAAREAGLRVAVMHLEALRFMGNRDVPVSPELVGLVTSREVDWILPDDDVDVEVLLVRYPPILQYPPATVGRVRARHVLVMANQGPVEADGSDQRYVVRDVSARAEQLFDGSATWVPQSPTIRRLLVEQDPDVRLTDWDNPGLIDVEEWAVRPPVPPGADGRPVVVGRHSRDDRIKFPGTWAELLRGYAFGDGYEVRMLGAERTVAELRATARADEPLPDNWQVMPHGAADVRDFLRELDFYLYLDNTEAHESFGRTLLEAAASGVLTIAHPKHRPTFGEAFDYALPGEAQDLVARYVADPAAYAARVTRTLDEVRRRYGHPSFVQKLRSLGTGHALGHGGRGTTTDEALPLPSAGGAEGSPTETVTIRPGRVPVDTVRRRGPQADGAQVEQIPLRSAADAERADGLTVLHRGAGEETLRAWLHPVALHSASPTWNPGDLLLGVPEEVVAVLVWRDGLVWAAGRGRWGGHPRHEELCRLASAGGSTEHRHPDRERHEIRPGWSDLAWWQHRPPQSVDLAVGPSHPRKP